MAGHAFCHRVPEFPLDTEGDLFKATRESIAKDGPLDLKQVHDLFTVLTSVRRDIHAHPEPGFEETRTHARLRELLVGLAGVEESAIRTCAKTGLVVDIRGKKPSPKGSGVRTIAVRADMDALRMTEKNRNLPYRSTTEGVAHLCGHDGHMASLVGFAALVARKAALLPSDTCVRLLFQPAEEGPGGALPMIEDGCMEGVDEVYGYHNWPSVPLGSMWVRPGFMMGHPSEFTIKIKGRGGHGSQPQVAVDPVVVAGHVIVALQTVVSRNVHPQEQAVLSITMVHGGEVHNVIPDEVTLGGTIRDLKPEVFETMDQRVRSIVRGVCDAFGATAEVDITSLYAAVDNHPEQAEAVRALAAELLGEDKVSAGNLPILGGEDFSYYMHKAPGAFFLMGGREAQVRALSMYGGKGPKGGTVERSNCMCHNTAFDFNDNLIPFAVVFWVRLVEARLGVDLYPRDELPIGFGAEDAAGDDPLAKPVDIGGKAKRARRG